jgi:hypothetical protein
VWIDAKDLEEESASRTTTASDVAARAAAEKAAADAKDKAARDAARRAALDEDSWDMPQPYRY